MNNDTLKVNKKISNYVLFVKVLLYVYDMSLNITFFISNTLRYYVVGRTHNLAFFKTGVRVLPLTSL